MQIQSIKLKNFERFQDLTIDLGNNPKKIIALVGPNGCGKSSVLDGIYYHITRLDQDINYNKTAFKIAQMQSKDIQLLFIANFKNADLNRRIYTYYKESPNILYFRNINNSTSFFKKQTNDQVSLVDLDTDSRIILNSHKLYWQQASLDELNKLIGDWLRLTLSFKPSNAIFAGSDDFNLLFSKDDYKTLESGDDQPFFGKFFLSHLSLGEKEVIDILLDLYVNKDLYKDTIFLFDEPELHLNTSIQRNLLIAMNSLINPNCQVWLATHSIGFMRALQVELKDECQIIEFKKDTPWASSHQNLRPIIPKYSEWHRIFNTPLDELSKLTLPSCVVLCEGGSNIDTLFQGKVGLDAEVFEIIFGTSKPDTLFISVGCGSKLPKYVQDLDKLISHIYQSNPPMKLISISDGDKDPNNQHLFYAQANTKSHDSSMSLEQVVTTTSAPQTVNPSLLSLINDNIDNLKEKVQKALENNEAFDTKDFTSKLDKLVREASKLNSAKMDCQNRYLIRREIENYLLDKEVLEAFASNYNIEFYCVEYKRLLNKYYEEYCNKQQRPASTSATLFEKIKFSELKGNIKEIRAKCFNFSKNRSLSKFNTNQFKLELAKTITSEMNVYKELRSCIFGDENEAQPESTEQASSNCNTNTYDLKSPSHTDKS